MSSPPRGAVPTRIIRRKIEGRSCAISASALQELQQIDFVAGGMSLLRTRIREGSRFTVFDIDPQTAQQWGHALLRWAESQERA